MNVLGNIATDSAVHRIGWALLYFTWQGVAVAALLACAMWLFRRRSANLRYFAACVALLLMLALPAITIWLAPNPGTSEMPGAIVSQRINAQPRSLDESQVTQSSNTREERRGPSTGLAVNYTLSDASHTTAGPPNNVQLWRQRIAEILRPNVPSVVLAWMIGVFGLSLWHLRGWMLVQRLRRASTEPVDQTVGHVLRALRHRLGISCSVRAVNSGIVCVPTVVGWLRPVIFLPAQALTGLTTEQMEMILAHELAHIRRHDYVVNLFQTAAETLLFYHPAVWWVSRRIREERENCCDDLAISTCGRPVTYAKALAAVARLSTARPQLAVAAVGGSLLVRVRRVLGFSTGKPDRGPVWLAGVLAVTCIIATIGILAISCTADNTAGINENDMPVVTPAATRSAVMISRIAWGTATAGVQIGARLMNEPRTGALHVGDELGFGIYARNITNKTIEFRLIEGGPNAWSCTIDKSHIKFGGPTIGSGILTERALSLAPGGTSLIDTMCLLLVPTAWNGETGRKPILPIQPGDYQISFDPMIQGLRNGAGPGTVSAELDLELLPIKPERMRELSKLYPPSEVVVAEVATHFLRAVRDNDNQSLDRLTLKYGGRVKQMRRQWQELAAHLRNRYSGQFDQFARIQETMVIHGYAAVRIASPKATTDEYLCLILDRGPDVWLVSFVTESPHGISLRQNLLDYLKTPKKQLTLPPAKEGKK